MNIYGIVCEYNPFHNGHLYQIEQIKACGADGIVCVMSGNFVQRGDFAIMQKHARAEAAIRCGADIVFELPVPYVLSSAERFAYGAISIFENLGIISSLAFGTESNDLNSLLEIAKLLISGDLNSEITAELSLGVSYPTALSAALNKRNKSLAELISTPNNILAVEYLKALLMLNSDIKPIAFKRIGAEHDCAISSDTFASASHIRSLITDNAQIKKLIPPPSLEIVERESSLGHAPVNIKTASTSVISSLKRLSPEDFRKYPDVSEGLENRIFDAVASSNSLEDAINSAKTKRYTHSRLRRIFLNAFLNITSDFPSTPPYVKLLAFSDSGRAILKRTKEVSRIPIITRPSAIKNESDEAKKLLALEKRADDIYSLFMETPLPPGAALKTSPVFVSDK